MPSCQFVPISGDSRGTILFGAPKAGIFPYGMERDRGESPLKGVLGTGRKSPKTLLK